MKSHHIVPFFVLVSLCGLLIWRAGDDEHFVQSRSTIAALALPARVNAQSVAGRGNAALSTPRESAVAGRGAGAGWPNTEVVNALRDVDSNAASVRAAIAKAQPELATDQDVQLLVGALIISHGDPIDGLAWQLLACMYCTPVDKRIGDECVPEGLCDPHLAYVDALKRDFGEQAVADALARMEQIQVAIATGASLAPFTEVDEKRFPRDVGECVQLRTPTEECPPEEILRQTLESATPESAPR